MAGKIIVKDAAAPASGPTLNSVHSNAPLASTSTAYVRAKKKRKVRVADSSKLTSSEPKGVQLVKADAYRQIVYGVALAPDAVDSQGDSVRPEEIERAAHQYLAKAVRGLNSVHKIQHSAAGFSKTKPSIVPVESFVAPADFQYEPGGEVIRKGSWVLAAHVEDPALWQSILDGRFTGWSVGGSGLRTPLSQIGKGETVAAGIAVRAQDTGRVLMLQRSISDMKHEAAGKWEFPGGCLDEGETAVQAAVREWQEETGTTLPTGTMVGQWKSGVYEGFVYVVPREADVRINTDADDRLVANPDDPDGDDSEVLAWWPPSDAKRMPGLRAGVELADWNMIERSVPNGVFKDASAYPIPPTVTLPAIHLHIDKHAVNVAPPAVTVNNHMPPLSEAEHHIHVAPSPAPVVHNHVEPTPIEAHHHVVVEAARKPTSLKAVAKPDGSREYIPSYDDAA